MKQFLLAALCTVLVAAFSLIVIVAGVAVFQSYEDSLKCKEQGGYYDCHMKVMADINKIGAAK
jgi:hypothetical protein